MINLVVILRDEFFLVRLDCRVHILQGEMIDFLIDLLELTVNVALANDIGGKLLFFRVVLEFFVVEHKLFIFSILYNTCSRGILMINDFFASVR